MPTTSFDKESIKQSIIGKLQRYNGRTIAEATPQQIYKAVASTVRDQIMQKWMIAPGRAQNQPCQAAVLPFPWNFSWAAACTTTC